MKRAPSLACFLAQRANADHFPPVLHQARLLAAHGPTQILDAATEVVRPVPGAPPTIERRRARGENGRAGRLKEVAAFVQNFRAGLARRPVVAIAYEMDASALLMASRRWYPATKRIVHLHEVPDAALHEGSHVSAVARRYLKEQARNADLVVVADQHRADLLADEWRLPARPAVVMNCPMRLQNLPESRLLPLLHARGLPISDIVHYQGSIGADHGLEDVIRSMPMWPEKAVLALVGSGPPGVVAQLKILARDAGVGERVLWLGRVPYEEVLSYAVGARVGLTLLAPTNNNWRYSAGASNKRFEYAALGIPQVTNAGPGIDTLFTGHGIATAVAPTDASAIAWAVNGWLSDGRRASEAGDCARQLHLATYNYEVQFEPVLRMLERWKV